MKREIYMIGKLHIFHSDSWVYKFFQKQIPAIKDFICQ